MEEKQSAGQEMAKWLKPGGCILVLLLTVLAMVMLFTAGKDPIKGYEPPQSPEYYAQNPEALLDELEANVFPQLTGIGERGVTEDGRVRITLTGADYAVTRSAILHYYDLSLFEFVLPTD